MTPPPAVELRGIEKSFGSVHANRGVSLAIARGSITGIVGENGAGKSTLMSILYGLYEADAGQTLIDGKAVRIRTPRDALAQGIGMVHQHFMLVEPFTVLENLVLGAERGPLLRPTLVAARAELQRLARDFGLTVDPDARIADLSVGEQQRVEILKVLFRGARILILDEPSAVLTPQETEGLFDILRGLRQRGVTVLLITHKLREIMAVTDTVFVMRQGALVAECRTPDTSPAELAELMVGRKVRLRPDKAEATPGEVLLHAKGLSLRDRRGVALLSDVELVLRAGEITGLAGVSGNGQSELLQVLSGIRRLSAGTIEVLGRRIDATHPADPRALRSLGLAHVPEDRLRYGLVAPFRADETAILGYHEDAPFSRHRLLDHGAARDHCMELMQSYDVRPPLPALRSSGFSGGNQQKLITAREMAQQPRVLLVGQPTRGVDIGAIELIHRRIVEARDAGCAVLLVSAELDEILGLADRILVMFAGRIVGERVAADADERTLGLMMANAMPGAAA